MASSYRSVSYDDDDEASVYDHELAMASASFRRPTKLGNNQQQSTNNNSKMNNKVFHPAVLSAAFVLVFVVIATVSRLGIASSSDSSTSAFDDGDTAADPVSFYLRGEIDDTTKQSLFDTFKKTHVPEYETDAIEQERFLVFKDNVDRIAAINDARTSTAADVYAVAGITKFADLSPDEFKDQFLSPDAWSNGNSMGGSAGEQPEYFDGICHSCVAFEDIDIATNSGSDIDDMTDLDWRDYSGVVSDVQDQGYCGSCWAFGTTGDIEGTWNIATGETVSLSEQQLVSCDTSIDEGCNGGVQEFALDYVISAGGLVSDKTYPYVSGADGTDFQCDDSLIAAANVVATITEWQIVARENAPGDEDRIKEALIKSGPITVAVNADPEQYYTGGIDNPSDCDPTLLDHAVLVVGFGVEDGVEYWTIKNSWGLEWGEDGFYRILRNANVCGVAMDAVHSVV